MQDDTKGALILLTNALLGFFKQAKSFTKFIVFLLLCSSMWLLNDSTEFIRSYRISHKIENVKEIENLVNNPKIDTTTKKMLQELEYRIIYRESLLERLYLFLDEDQSSEATVIPSAGIEQNTKTRNNSLNGFMNSYFKFFLHVFSSAWLAVLIFVYCIIWIYKDRNTNMRIPFTVMLISLGNGLIFSIITLLFPKSSIEVINYLINALFYTVVQLLLLIILLPKLIQHEEQIVKILETEH